MLAAALRARFPQCTSRVRNLHLRSATSESAQTPAAHEDRRPAAANLTDFDAVRISDDKEVALDPKVQTQLKRMLRVDHAGEFAAGNCNLRFLSQR
jgi:hypothetical protein